VPEADVAILRDPKFWHGVFASQFSSIAQQLRGDLLEQTLGTSDRDALTWWNGFTQFYEGVLDEADGYVNAPASLTIALANGVRVKIEYHPGGSFYRLHTAHGSELLGETGPHWRLPGLKWAELVAIAGAAGRTGSVSDRQCLLVLLPLVGAEATSDIGSEQRTVADAIEEAAGARAPGAKTLAAAWADDVRRGSRVRWSEGVDGPANDSSEGTRSEDVAPTSRRRLNEMIAAAIRAPDLRSSETTG
jgi:hypothetical protein